MHAFGLQRVKIGKVSISESDKKNSVESSWEIHLIIISQKNAVWHGEKVDPLTKDDL